MPEPIFGMKTLSMNVALTELIANITFSRPFQADSSQLMNITWDDRTKDYKLLLNWGVFNNENDTSIDKVFGAKDMQDAIAWKFEVPKGGIRRQRFKYYILSLSAAILAVFPFL